MWRGGNCYADFDVGSQTDFGVYFMSINTDYELFVRDIQQILLNAQNLETVTARHNIKLLGISGQEHQIDVYWEYRIAGVLHKVAIECKLHGRKVDLSIVRDFFGVLDDIPGLRGVIVCPSGFTLGAETYARSKNIGLKVIRDAQDADFEGRVNSIEITMIARFPTKISIQIYVDKDWIASNKSAEVEHMLNNFRGLIKTDGVYIREMISGDELRMQYIGSHLPVLEVEDISGVNEWEKTFVEGYLIHPEYSRVKINSIKVSYEIEEIEHKSTVGGSTVGHVLVKDAFEGTLLFIDKKRVIYGDTEQEGIRS